MYESFKTGVLGKVIGDGQCVSLVVNNGSAYVEHLFPGVSWPTIFPPVTGAKQLFIDANSNYFLKITNDHNNPNQVPQQGDIMVFDATPQAGYSNTFQNPYGHTGVCDSADANGYSLLQQNSPTNGSAANVTHYAWKYRPCIGWLRPIIAGQPVPTAPAPTPPPVPAPTSNHTITLPKTTGPWHLRDVHNANRVIGIIDPRVFSRDLTYAILNNPAQGIYTIQSQDYGIGNLNANGSDVIIK